MIVKKAESINEKSINLLVIGGSQGAKIFDRLIKKCNNKTIKKL